MSELRRSAAIAVARPVIARRVAVARLKRSIRLRASQDVVLVRRVTDAVDDSPFLCQRRVLLEVVRIGVQVRNALGDHHALGVVPGTRADTSARVDRGQTALLRLAQIGVPGVISRVHRGREVLADLIRAREAVEGAGSGRGAGDEERHRHLRLVLTLRKDRG